MKLATLCYVRDRAAGTTLMLHRIKKENDIHEGKWNGLGGKFERGETPEECVIREVYEESGLVISFPELKGLLTFPDFDGCDDWYVFVFEATRFTGELIDSNEGNLEWIPDDDVCGLNLWEGDNIFFPWLRENRFFSAKFVYKNDSLLSHSVEFH